MTRSSVGIDPGRTFAVDLDKYCALRFGGARATPARVARLALRDHELRSVACFRFRAWADALWRRDKVRGLVPMMLAGVWRRRMLLVHHAEIDRNARIGPGFLLMHRTGLFIGPITIGDNCVMHHNTTIGQRVADSDVSVPRIGNNVWLGPGVTICGGIVIGDGATISAGSVVSRDVPPRALVAGNPGRVIAADYDNSAILNYRVHRDIELAAVGDTILAENSPDITPDDTPIDDNVLDDNDLDDLVALGSSDRVLELFRTRIGPALLALTAIALALIDSLVVEL